MPTGPDPSPTHATALEVLGAATCEDTAIVRSRLDALGVAYRYRDVDRDADALDRLRALNEGHRITPTVIQGQVAVAEPTLERLGELIAAMGPHAEVAEPVQLHGDITAWPIPTQRRPAADGSMFDLGSLRGRSQVCLFLAHGPDCQACFGYARQLAGQREALETADGALVVVTRAPRRAEGATATDANPEALDEWRHGLPTAVVLLLDADATWHKAIATIWASTRRPPRSSCSIGISRHVSSPRRPSRAASPTHRPLPPGWASWRWSAPSARASSPGPRCDWRARQRDRSDLIRRPRRDMAPDASAATPMATIARSAIGSGRTTARN